MNRQPDFIPVSFENRNSPEKEGDKGFARASRISHVVENRYDGKGSFLAYDDGQTTRVRDTFEELTARLPNRLELRQVAAADRESLRLSINPEHIRDWQASQRDGRGTATGSRVTLQNGTDLYVVEGTSEIAERLTVIEDQVAKTRTAGY